MDRLRLVPPGALPATLISMKSHAIFRAGFLALAVLSVLVPTSPVSAQGGTVPAQEGKVSPETLPQGFVVIVEDQAKMASASRPIYFASGVNSWDPGDAEYTLSPRSDGRWQFVFEGGTLGENVEFKFTLGSWANVETDPEGQDIPNRTFPDVARSSFKPGERPVIELTIPKFREGTDGHVIAQEYRAIDATGTVKRLQVAGGAGSANGTMRDLLVWLPPGYDDAENADRAYPVLYMHDGQHLYQPHGHTADEWRMDETATELIESGEIEPIIVVGIPNGGAARTEEYVPTMGEGVTIRGTVPAGDDHVAWLVREVMPRVERAFRVETGPEHTGVGGASAGGLIALHAGLKRPGRFGLVLAESPALQLDQIGLDMVERYSSAKWLPSRLFIGMGGAEHLPGSGFYDKDSQRHVNSARELSKQLDGRCEVMLSIESDAGHDEAAWAGRLPAALRFLFPAE